MKEKIKLPPASMVFVGDGDFIKIGERFRDFLIHLAGLQKDHHILDVGCGIGRIAIPLTQYLSAEGVYWGFDIMDSGIQWCKDNITPEYPNFQFLRCDVYNKHYNDTGKILAQNFRFPFENELFDLEKSNIKINSYKF